MHPSLTKEKVFSSLIALLCIFSLMQTPSLNAAGWGKTETLVEFQGASWNGVYCDLDNLKLKAMIPNYSGASMSNGLVELRGKIGKKAYLIQTSMNPGFTPPKTAAAFLKMIQEANTHATVVMVDVTKIGGKFAVDIIPKNPSEDAFWRFLVTNNRLIKMGTDEQDGKRRQYFFDSISLR